MLNYINSKFKAAETCVCHFAALMEKLKECFTGLSIHPELELAICIEY
jgi:hypothetical protein